MKSLRSFRLTHRIAVVGVIGLIGLGALAALRFESDRQQSSTQRSADAMTALESEQHRLAIDFLQARRAEKDFLLRSDATYLEKHTAFVSAIQGRLSDLAASAQAQGIERVSTDVGALKAAFGAYVAGFEKIKLARLALGLNEKEGHEGRLREAVRAAESRLKMVDAPKLMILMLMLRRHEKDFMLGAIQPMAIPSRSALRSSAQSLPSPLWRKPRKTPLTA